MTVAALLGGKGPRVATIRALEKIAAAIQQLNEERIGAFVVVDRWGQLTRGHVFRARRRPPVSRATVRRRSITSRCTN